MIDADRGDHRDRGVDDVGGIPPPAHADLDHGDIDGRVGEGRERHRGQDFELAHLRAIGRLGLLVHQFHERLDLDGRSRRIALG